MGSLKVHQMEYQGSKYYFVSPRLDKHKITIIEGWNGTGKSTFCNLIYFGLGGRVPEFLKDSKEFHKQIVLDEDNFVDLYISIKKKSFHLRRFIAENEITITPFSIEKIKNKDGSTTENFILQEGDKKIEILPLKRNKEQPKTFSDWILKKLGITVVELWHGYKNFKISFSELMRLVYYDQQSDPNNIYKKLDTKQNYISDSDMLRGAIFELLIGKTYSKFYQAVTESKKAQRERDIAKAFMDEYRALADKFGAKGEVKNISFLKEEVKLKEEQLEKLQNARKAFKKNRSSSSSIDPNIEAKKNEIIDNEMKLSKQNEHLLNLYEERYRLAAVKSEAVREVEQIEKIIHTHNQLNLFSPDTCPYCLTNVDRDEGHCVCGAEISEEQYERFFYTPKEYKDILKAKIKALSTVKLATAGCNQDIEYAKAKIKSLKNQIIELKRLFRQLLGKIDQPIDLESLNDIDDKILETREDLNELFRRIDTEAKLESLTKEYDIKREKLSEKELERNALEIEAKKDIAKKVKSFSEIYSRLMSQTLVECRSARISPEDYMPIIDEGVYKEQSARVSKRLMYYLALMEMSLKESDVTFPKFLLVDTPDTLGIEPEELINCIDKFRDLEKLDKDFQIILTTGIGKYPVALKDNRVLFMPTKDDHLLKLRESAT